MMLSGQGCRRNRDIEESDIYRGEERVAEGKKERVKNRERERVRDRQRD